ncbi:MAG: ABC transporter permease [Ignavibacteria bacterium]|nr:ABC transporter permease [Ignavibacteria bacterium]
MNKIFSISLKEFRQIGRDRRSLMIIFALPVFLLTLFGYAITLDVNTITLGIYDRDKSETSRDFISTLSGSSYFKITEYVNSENEINPLLDHGKAKCVVVIPEDFSSDLARNRNVSIQYLVDGVDANTATIVLSYVAAATATFSRNVSSEVLSGKGIKQFQPLNLQPQFWYNKDLSTTKFFIPGLIAMILIIISVILTSISLVREKELGTIEQIIVSPVTSFQLIIGKILPYLVISILIAASILIMGYFLFGVEVKGSYFLLFAGTICYLLCTLSMGIFISTVAESQQVAFQISQLASQLPTVILSGFIFPVESMPLPIQILSYITPAKYYIVILRDILLKGAGFEVFKEQILYLLIFATVLITVSTVRIKRSRTL